LRTFRCPCPCRSVGPCTRTCWAWPSPTRPAFEAAARWDGVATNLAQAYEAARDAIAAVGTACADYAHDFRATAVTLEAARSRGDLPATVTLHRHGQLLPISKVTVDGFTAETYEPVALIAEAVLEGARESGLSNTGPAPDGTTLTNAALALSGRMENRDHAGGLIIQSPATRLKARAHRTETTK
jgi:hypothetical protein